MNQQINNAILFSLKLLAFISAFKNIIYWRYPLLNSGELFHYPIFSWLGLLPQSFYALLSLICLAAAFIAFFKKSIRFFAWVLLLCGLSNLIFQFADYLGLHHDMYLSGLAFIAIGIYFLKPSAQTYGVILAIAASTYLLSGLYKITPDFIDGSMTADIIHRSSRYFYGDFFIYFAEAAVVLSIFAILVEIIEPFILIFARSSIKKISVLATLPFHLGILATGTGTVYNLTYPILFWFLVYFDPKLSKQAHSKLDFVNLAMIRITVFIAIIYIIFLGSMLPSLFAAIMERLL